MGFGQAYTYGAARRLLLRERTINPGPVATTLLKLRGFGKRVTAARTRARPKRGRKRARFLEGVLLRRRGAGARGNPAPAAVAAVGVGKKLAGLFKGARLKSPGQRQKEREGIANELAQLAAQGDVLAEAELGRLAGLTVAGEGFATKRARNYAANLYRALQQARIEAEAEERGARAATRAEAAEARRQRTREAAITTAGTVAQALLRGRGLPRRTTRRRPARRRRY